MLSAVGTTGVRTASFGTASFGTASFGTAALPAAAVSLVAAFEPLRLRRRDLRGGVGARIARRAVAVGGGAFLVGGPAPRWRLGRGAAVGVCDDQVDEVGLLQSLVPLDTEVRRDLV
jgi:hypothetical protein